MRILNYSPVESRRFGLRVWRGTYEQFDARELLQVVTDDNFDLVIVRYPTADISRHYPLVAIPHCHTLHADSLVYYSASLQKIEIKPLRNHLHFVPVTEATEDRLARLVRVVFEDYQNHYYANPCLKRQDIVEGYLEWAMSFAKGTGKDITWIITDSETDEDVAFLACSADENKSVCELKVGGVLPSQAGRGLYSDFVRYAQSYFCRMGIQQMLTSTQLQNISVQRAWQTHGFRFNKSYETYHIVRDSLWNSVMGKQ